MKEKWVFEIVEVERLNNNQWKVGGYAFDTITIEDVLSTTEQSNNDQELLRIEAISSYGHQLEKLYRGLSGRLSINSDNFVDFTGMKYLYRVNPNE